MGNYISVRWRKLGHTIRSLLFVRKMIVYKENQRQNTYTEQSRSGIRIRQVHQVVGNSGSATWGTCTPADNADVTQYLEQDSEQYSSLSTLLMNLHIANEERSYYTA